MLNVISSSNRRSTPLRPRSVARLLAGRPLVPTLSLAPDGGFSSGGSTVSWLMQTLHLIGETDTSKPGPNDETPVPKPVDGDGSVQSGESDTSKPPPTDGDGSVQSLSDASSGPATAIRLPATR